MAMMKRAFAFAALAAIAGAGFVSPAGSQDVPPHSHLLLTGIELDETGEWPLSIKKCRPLANGHSVPLQAHHANLHTGRAGEALWEAGNAVVPVFPGDTPWEDCETLMEFFFG
ncbi:MAG TPA: hypothetical protein VM242_02370 [Acidimicrobiales bacterium]|jgi:hypothetical protein|nr:hypothetical protein [Acidimicrobiales bacterium]